MGHFEMKKSVQALPLLRNKLAHRPNQSASSHLAQMVNRTATVLEGKGILRYETEEVLSATRFKKHDELAAEFIRSFRHRDFLGKSYLSRYESMHNQVDEEVPIIVPKGMSRKDISDDVSLYGFRGTHPDMFFLSPWEFWQWFFRGEIVASKTGVSIYYTHGNREV